MRIFFICLFFVIVAVISIAGFRGAKSDRTPLYIFPDMDFQKKYHPQGENQFFRDRRNDRLPVSGTVIRGTQLESSAVFSPDYENELTRNPELATGHDLEGNEIETIPLKVDSRLMHAGREKFDIYCAVCHGPTGGGDGVTFNYGIAAANLQSSLYRDRPDGNLYNTITNGFNTMLGYGDKLTVEERWAVVAYVRALQRAYSASEEDLTPQQKQELGL